MSQYVGTSKHLGSSGKYCDEYGKYASGNPKCRMGSVDWEYECPCEISNQERDLKCGLPTRGFDVTKMGFTYKDLPEIQKFAEANRWDPECRQKARDWRKKYYPHTKEIY